jgi:hypothetical protein
MTTWLIEWVMTDWQTKKQTKTQTSQLTNKLTKQLQGGLFFLKGSIKLLKPSGNFTYHQV